MKPITSLYDVEPPEYVGSSNEKKDRREFFKKFCDEQPSVIAFLTKRGIEYNEYQTRTALTILLAQKLWWNYIGNGLWLPRVELGPLERHYVSNKHFVEDQAAEARNQGMNALDEVIRSRPQRKLRILALATLFDETQNRLIGPEDVKEEPKMVEDQNHAHALLGAVLEAFEEVAVTVEASKRETLS